MVARFVRDEEAVGSNPATPTVNRRDRLVPAILYVHSQTDCQHGRKGGNEAGVGGVATVQHAATAVPEGGGRAPLRHAAGYSTRGRRQGLAGLRADAPSRRLAARTAREQAAARGCIKQPGPRDRPHGARNTRGATSKPSSAGH